MQLSWRSLDAEGLLGHSLAVHLVLGREPRSYLSSSPTQAQEVLPEPVHPRILQFASLFDVSPPFPGIPQFRAAGQSHGGCWSRPGNKAHLNGTALNSLLLFIQPLISSVT